MATAVTMQATHIRPAPVPIAPSPSNRTRPLSSTNQQSHNRLQTKGDSAAGSGSFTTQLSPCDGCKRRNSRCAMNERAGKCYSCEFHRQECTFTPARPRKRSYDEAIEGLQALTNGFQSRTAVVKPKISGPESVSFSINRDEEDREGRRSCRYIGGTTDIELSLLENLPSEALPFLGGGTTRVERYDPRTFMEILPDGHRGLEFTRIEELEGLVGFDRDILIDFYLENIQPSYPLLTNRDVTYLSSSRSKLDPSLLAAVYSLAASSKSHSNQYLLPKLDELTSGLLQESFIRPRLCSVQAALIAAQCWSMNSSILTMQINAAAFDLGLHQDCSQWNISESHKSLRRRLAWALYAHDKWTAFSTGRPSLISPNNWAVRRLSPTDFEPPQSNVPTVELFSQYITLSTLLSSVLDTFYTLASSSMVSPQQILGLAKPVQLQLKEWYSNLPACLKMDSSIINSGTDSPRPENHSSKPLAFLHLAYFTTEILLHRCIIRSLSPASVSSTPPSAYTPLHHICRLAAKTRLISSLDFCNRLRPEHISAFWPVGSRTQFALIGSFGTLLLATSPTNEEEDFYSARLHEFRWTLGVCSSAAGEDRLGFSDALDKLDLGVELWQKGRELKGSRNRSVKDVAEEMKRTQPPGAMSLQQLPGSSLPTTRIRPEFADGVMDVDFENGFNTDDESLEGSDD